jgi:hypothetical protein
MRRCTDMRQKMKMKILKWLFNRKINMESKRTYSASFMKAANFTARQGKQVCIRKDYHDRILKITQIIGGNEVSIASYMDNVLAHHFATFQGEITELYNERKEESIF